MNNDFDELPPVDSGERYKVIPIANHREERRFQAACAAMTGMLAASAFPTTDECRANVVAHSRRYADDLLAALARKDGGA